MKRTQKDKIKALLSDGNFHHMRELNNVCYRYSARLHDLTKEGYEFEKRQLRQGEFEYRMKQEEQKMTNEEFMQYVQRRQEQADERERIDAGIIPQMEMF